MLKSFSFVHFSNIGISVLFKSSPEQKQNKENTIFFVIFIHFFVFIVLVEASRLRHFN